MEGGIYRSVPKSGLKGVTVSQYQDPNYVNSDPRPALIFLITRIPILYLDLKLAHTKIQNIKNVEINTKFLKK